MGLTTLINFCKDNFPEKMIEVCESIDLLIDTLNGLKTDIGNAIPTLNDNESFDLMHQYTDYSKEIVSIIQNLNNISNDITLSDTEVDTTNQDETQDVNYNDKSFNVDSKVPHTLYEDFTYTKPAGIKIENTYLEANEWKVIFNKICQYLLNKDHKLFISFLNDKTMRGRTRKYFSSDPGELREAELIKGSDIYLECNVNAMFVRNMIIKMLEKYEIPKRQCNIFIRRDLTSLHNENEIEIIRDTAKNLREADGKGIGQYAKEYFTKYFQSNLSNEDIKKFTNKDWCHNNFGIRYPILKQVDTGLPIKEQVNYNNQYRRYYVEPVLKINGKDYILCSQWYPHFKPKLLSWIDSTEKSPNLTIDNHSIKFDKSYCSITLPKSLFIFILKTIEQYGNTQFETGRLTTNLSDIILKQTDYEKPHHIINNIRRYLEDNDIIALCDDCKKGKYKIIDVNGLQHLISKFSETETT